jgi:DNA polymerase III delta subunit
VDTWLRGDIKGVLKEYAMITRMGMTPEELFWAIHWQIQALGYVAEAARVHAGEDAIARATKLHPYVVSKCMRVIKGMAPGFLTRTFSRLRAIDVQIKTTPSKFDDVFLYFLITS